MLTLIKTCLNMLIGQKCPKIQFFGLIRLTKWSLWATEGYIAHQIWMKSIHRKRFSVWYLWTVFGHRLKDVWLCLLLKMAEIPIFWSNLTQKITPLTHYRLIWTSYTVQKRPYETYLVFNVYKESSNVD